MIMLLTNGHTFVNFFLKLSLNLHVFIIKVVRPIDVM